MASGKKKLSKAERLRLQKEEEEERRLKEEEEARLQAQQEEAARLEKERLERQQMERLEAKDQERRESELAELCSLEEKFPSAEQWKTNYRAHAKWEHYVSCDGSPDPTVLQEINTFMSLWREDQNENIQFVMEKGKEVLNLIEKLQFLLLDTPPNEITEKETVQYQETILDLQNLLHQKYNGATEHLLKTDNMSEDSDSGNMQLVVKDKNVTLCIWANLKKNIRFKNHVFREVQHGFDLPKSLAVNSVAVRIFHSHYDHVSPLWLQCQYVPKLKILDSKEVTVDLKENVEEAEEEEEKAKEEPSAPTEEELYSNGIKSASSFKESTNNIADINEKTEEENEKKSEILDILSQVQIPVMQEETSEKEEVIIDENIVDLRQFIPVGGVYHIDVLQLPPRAKEIKNWSMVEVLDGGLETYPYPPESEETEDAAHPPIGITLRLPDNDVIYFEDPVVARWDPAGQQWRTDGISNIIYETEQGKVIFEMDTFYTIALLQDAHLNMPYQAWELRPSGTDELLLIVTTAFAEVQIQVKDHQCMLSTVMVEEKDVLSHLTGKWMTPVHLTVVLKKAGINIFPGEYSHKYVCVNKKAPLAEFRAYQQMALVASAFAFSWSKWNLESGEEQVVLKISEHLKTDSVEDEDWSLYMFNGQRAQRLKITEASEAFSEELEDHSEFHSTLYHMLKDFASNEAIDKVKKANFLFIDTVYQLLLATRVLTYS
ncbi:dynein axonemal intermediate chain 7 isoform X2 [Dromaius novaehollandiae]|uniref:dynein axonemal intermediate chain 7 isoform X2 n=1 Tax=Dromaius novaehollandiae TaxID=8790 RepID=UPI00311FA2CA